LFVMCVITLVNMHFQKIQPAQAIHVGVVPVIVEQIICTRTIAVCSHYTANQTVYYRCYPSIVQYMQAMVQI